MKLFILTLSLALLCIAGDVSGGNGGTRNNGSRRYLTLDEQHDFLPVLKTWMTKNWKNEKEYTGGFISQKVEDINLCCIDSVGEKELYIVDIAFHAKWFEKGNVIDESDMVQRLLLLVVNGVIKDWDPMPAHQINDRHKMSTQQTTL